MFFVRISISAFVFLLLKKKHNITAFINLLYCGLHYIFFGPDEFAQNVEKTDQAPTSDKDTQALLKQAPVPDVLDGWKDGILTIGTFGFDPLKPFNQQKEYLVLESEEDIDEESQHYSFDSTYEDEDPDNLEDEEVNPLMLTTLGHSFDDVGSNFDADVMEKPDVNVLLTLDGEPLAPLVASNQKIAIRQEISEVDQKKKKGERTTLADLFLADADVKMKLDSGKDLPADSGKKLNVRSKNSLSFAKKFIPRVKEDSSPIKNLQRVSKTVNSLSLHFQFYLSVDLSFFLLTSLLEHCPYFQYH